MKISLAKALKTKNTLVGKINELKSIIMQNNSKAEGHSFTLDLGEIHKELVEKSAQLVDLKTKIGVANIGIVGKVTQMAELKTMAAWYKGLPTKEGKYTEYGEEPISYTCVFKQATLRVFYLELESQIEALQDQIDDYNATTFIDL